MAKDIKQLILKSGIPLEVSVMNKLKKFNFDDYGEISYEREGKIFSTDIHLANNYQFSKDLSIHFNFIIECKYKTQNHKWFFLEFPEDDYIYGGGRFDCRNMVFTQLADICLKDKLKVRQHDKYEPFNPISQLRIKNIFNLPFVNKGIELYTEGIEPNAIPEAVSQVSLGAIAAQKGSIEYNFEMFEDYYFENPEAEDWETHSIAAVTYPIIITTSKLFKFDSNISLEDIEKTEKIMDLCKEVQGVLLTNTEYKREEIFIEELFTKSPIRLSKKTLAVLEKNKMGVISSLDSLKLMSPGYIYVINYEYLTELFDYAVLEIEKFCNSLKEELEK